MATPKLLVGSLLLFALCQGTPLSSTAASTTSSTPCVGSTVCSLSCDFENGYCSWSQGITDDLDWSLKRGPTLTGSTGPDHDHTLQTVSGQYAYLEDNSGNPRDTADLQSPFLDLQSPVCLQFWYHMYGVDTGTLSVYTMSSSGTETPLWTTSGNQGQGWSMAKVTVRPVSDGGQTKVIVRARKANTNGEKGDIAIDDIKPTTGRCA